MTPADLKAARQKLGLSQEELAAVLIMPGGGRVVRRWEQSERDIPGPVRVLVDLMLNVPAVRTRLVLTRAPATPDPPAHTAAKA